MDNSNVFTEINSGKDKVSGAIKRTIKAYLPYIILALSIAFRIVIRLYDTKIVNPFTAVFWIDTMTSCVTTIFCYIVFIPLGEENEKLSSPSYATNCKLWTELSGKIRLDGLLATFRKYCVAQREEERIDKRNAYILNDTALSLEEYEEKYAALSDEELKKLYESGELAKDEYKAIKHANGKISVKPINSVLILSGVAKATYNDAGRDEPSFILTWLAKRPFMMILMSIMLNGVSAAFVGLSGYSVIYDMVIDSLCIIVAAVVGYGAGQQAIRHREDKIKTRILFIESFLEHNKSGS